MPLPIAGPITSDVPVRTIERDELRRKLEDPRFKLVMTLNDWDFRTKHIPGSLHFKDASEMLSTLRKDDEIVVYCTNPPCLASVAAYHRLVQEGYANVRRYAGGIEDWEGAGLPLDRMPTVSSQHPLPSGLGARTTAREVIGERRLDGATAIVTGGYAGIGLETTRVLAAAGAHVIVPARNVAKATAALSGLANVTIDELNLGVPATIDAFAAGFGEGPLHLLINNAGIMAAPLYRDARGLESQLAVNHVGHFRLFARLLPALRRASGARVVALSSRGHVRSAFDFGDPNFEHRPYDKMVAYGQSKTANVLFAVEADRRYAADGIRAFSLHPGAILETDLARNYDPEELKLVVERARRIGSFKTVEQGAATTIWCATSSQLAGLGGVYCENCDIAPVKTEGDDGVRPYAIDSTIAQRLWAWSERWLS